MRNGKSITVVVAVAALTGDGPYESDEPSDECPAEEQVKDKDAALGARSSAAGDERRQEVEGKACDDKHELEEEKEHHSGDLRTRVVTQEG